MTKSELRQALLAQRKEMADKASMDAAITRNVLQSEAYKSAQTLFIYVSMPLEIDTHEIIDDALRSGKAVAVPRCGQNHTMTFHQITSEADLQSGAYGIPEPSDDCSAIEPAAQDLCIVPALSVDVHGIRLGFGGGFYDRYLQQYSMRTMALTYGIYSELPAEKWDVPMHSAVTPAGEVALPINS